MVSAPPCPAAFRRIDWMECTGVPGALGEEANIGARRGGCSDAVDEDMLEVMVVVVVIVERYDLGERTEINFSF